MLTCRGLFRRGNAFAFRGSGACVLVTECDPIRAQQACIQGVQASCLRSTPFLPHRAISSSSSLDHLLKNGETVLAGSVCLKGMKVDNIVQTFHYVPVDFKHYASNSFAFVNDQAEQFRRGWRQLQAGKNDVYLLPESSSSIRKWRHSSFLHSVSSYQAEGRFTCKDDPAVKSGRDSCRWQNHAGRELPQQEGRRPKDRSGKKGGADSELPGWQPKEKEA